MISFNFSTLSTNCRAPSISKLVLISPDQHGNVEGNLKSESVDRNIITPSDSIRLNRGPMMIALSLPIQFMIGVMLLRAQNIT